MKIKEIIPKEPLVSIIMNCHNGEKYLKSLCQVLLINHIETGN